MAPLSVSAADEKRVKGMGFLNNKGKIGRAHV